MEKFTTMRRNDLKRSDWRRLGQALLLMVAAMLVAPSTRAETYDAAWWASVSPAERLAFVTGVVDCYLFDVRGKEIADESFASFQRAVTGYYDRHPEDAKLSVLDVMKTVPQKSKPENLQGGRSDDVIDGEYWRTSRVAVRVAFVEGYIACREKFLHQASGHMPATSIESKISQWYRLTEDGEVDDSRDRDKVGDLINRFVNEHHP